MRRTAPGKQIASVSFRASECVREGLAVLETCQCDPRDVRTCRSFNATVIAPMLLAPSARIERRRGSKPRAYSSAVACETARP